MEVKFAKSLKQLKEFVDEDVYIYGARTVAMRTSHFFSSNEINVKGFIVSQKYDNPMKLMNLDVLRIEKCKDRYFACIVIAVANYNVAKKIVEDFSQYNIKKVVVIYPTVMDKYLGCKIYNHNCCIKTGELNDNVSIVVDDSSKLIIEENVVIESGSILVADNSIVHIKSGVYIGENQNIISATCGSEVIIDSESYFKHINIMCFNRSKLQIDNDIIIRSDMNIDIINNSYMHIHSNGIFNSGYMSVYDGADMRIGNNCTFGERLALYVEKESEIKIGVDCMISINVAMITGLHHIFDCNNGKEITNIEPIILGNHVWVGANAQLISGSLIEDGCVVGANSLVNKLIPANSTCAGVPAKVLRNGYIKWER